MIQSGRFAPGAPPAAKVQLDPATARENEITNSNRTATANSSLIIGGAKTIYGRKTGKLYFEMVLNYKTVGPVSYATAGVIRTDADFDPVGRNAWVCGVYLAANTLSNIYADSVLQVNLGASASGHRFDFAYDLDAKLFWIRRQGGNWNANSSANPATGVGGIAMRDLGGYDVTPAVTSEVAGQQVTFNFEAEQFVGAVPSGFGPWPTDTTGDNDGLGLSKLDSLRNANVTLSGGDLTATRTGASPSGARSPDPKSSGKFYVEFIANALNGQGDGCGFGSQYATNAAVVNDGTEGVYVYRSGSIWSNSASRGNLGAVANGDRIDAAVDLSAKLVWFRRNGGNWNGSGTANPATGVGGIAFAYTSLAPLVGMGGTGGSVGSGWTVNLGGSAMIGAVPAGFTANWPRKYTPVVAPAALRYLWTGAVA